MEDYQALLAWHCFEVRQQQRTLPNKGKREITYLHHPGAVIIVPLSPQGKLIMERQFRPAINDWLLEFPAGTIEADEQSAQGRLDCAQRELAEETQYQAEHWHYLGELHPAPGFCDEVQYLYFASGLSPCAGELDEDEIIELLEVSPEQLEQWIVSGKVSDAKTIATYTRAKLAGLL